jgi:hypothetical protein
MFDRNEYYPKKQLSASANHEEFFIPSDIMGDLVCSSFDLVWIYYNKTVMPAIYSHDIVYPNHRPATLKEIEKYHATHQ